MIYGQVSCEAGGGAIHRLRRPGRGGERAALHEPGGGAVTMDPHSRWVRRQPCGDAAGVRGAARHRFQPGDRAAARRGMEAVGPDDLGVRAAPGRALSRRHAVHRRGRRVQPRAGARRDVRPPDARGQHRRRRGDRRSHRPHHDDGAGSAPVDAAQFRRHHVRRPGPRRTTCESRRTSTRAKRPLPRATPTAPGRSCSRSSSRTAAGSWSAIRTGGARPSTRTTSTASFTPGRDDAENLAALLDGEIDLLQAPLYSGLDQIRRRPGSEARVPAEAAHGLLRLRPGQRGAALLQHQGQEPVQGQACAPGDGPRDRHRADPSPAHGRALHPCRACWSPRASTAMRRNWTSRLLTTRKEPRRCWSRPATRTASA